MRRLYVVGAGCSAATQSPSTVGEKYPQSNRRPRTAGAVLTAFER